MANDNWRTPQPLFDTMNKEFNFVLDVAASHDNHKVKPYLTIDDDALSIDWAEYANSNTTLDGPKWIWCNPPYSNPLPWVKKALEAQADGVGVVMLLNCDISVAWFAEALSGVSEIRMATSYLKPTGGWSSGRIAFCNDDGTPVPGNSKPQFVLVFDPARIAKEKRSISPQQDDGRSGMTTEMLKRIALDIVTHKVAWGFALVMTIAAWGICG